MLIGFNRIVVGVLFSLFLLFSSCGVYRQNVVNTPVFTAKNELQVGAYCGSNGLDGQLSYSLTNSIGLILNYNDIGVKKKEFSSTNYTIDKHYFGEFGAGYYRKNNNGIRSEFFFLAGQGFSSKYSTGGTLLGDSTSSMTPFYADFKSLYYNRFVLQSDFGKINGAFEYVFTPRLFLVNFYGINDVNTNYSNTFPRSYAWSDFSFSLRYSFLNYFKFSGQVGVTLPITGIHDSYFASSPLNVSFGLVVNFKKKQDL